MRSMSTGFLNHPAEGEAEYRLADMVLDRTWGAFDGATVVGTLRSFPTPLTVPGPLEVTVGGADQRHRRPHPPPAGAPDRDDHQRPPGLGRAR